MKTIITKTLLSLCALFALSSLSSCEEDDWMTRSDDWMTRSDLSGTWRIDHVIPLDYGPCPYRPTDRLVFNYDGRLRPTVRIISMKQVAGTSVVMSYK